MEQKTAWGIKRSFMNFWLSLLFSSFLILSHIFSSLSAFSSTHLLICPPYLRTRLLRNILCYVKDITATLGRAFDTRKSAKSESSLERFFISKNIIFSQHSHFKSPSHRRSSRVAQLLSCTKPKTVYLHVVHNMLTLFVFLEYEIAIPPSMTCVASAAQKGIVMSVL